MRIWVDGQCFQTLSRTRGIGRYVADLLCGLHDMKRMDLVIGLNTNLPNEALSAKNYLSQLLPAAQFSFWEGVANTGEIFKGYDAERKTDERILAGHINRQKADIALSPSPFEGAHDRTSPLIKPEMVDVRTACIFHDAIPYRYPKQYLADYAFRRLYHRRLQQISGFDTVLCNSEFTESEYHDIFKRKNSRTIGAGLSESFKSTLACMDDDKSISRIKSPYVLYVGGGDWRKNIQQLISALSLIPEVQASELRCVIVGDMSEGAQIPLRRQWAELGLPKDGLLLLGWVSEPDLVALYQHAIMAVQPSFMEGFGLNALEAMASGTPFLGATGSAISEVVANPVQLFDPYSAADLAQLIKRVLADKAFRDELIAHGTRRHTAFTWKKAATATFEEFEALLPEGSTSAPVKLLAKKKKKRRLIMDVTSTALSPVMSGIQRVIHRLSHAMQEDQNASRDVVLSYANGHKRWLQIDNLNKEDFDFSPDRSISYCENDSYLLLDSSWTQLDEQRDRLVNAMLLGNEVVHGIHDIGPLTMSAMTDEGMPIGFAKWFRFILGHGTGIICVSKAVADEVYELIEAIQLPRPMKVGYFRLGGDFRGEEPDSEWLEEITRRPTFLIVGTIEPRKGQAVALAAFDQLWADGTDINLLIVGNAGWDTRLLQQRLREHPEAGKRLFWRSGLTDAQLCGAYASATALIMTSHLEGFGLPIVEAGNYELPVICSDIPVFRDVCNAAPSARFFKRGNALDLARQVQAVLVEGFEPHKGERISWPSWRASAKEVEEVILGGNWYRHYVPAAPNPNAMLEDIGNIWLDTPLSEEDQRHSIELFEGPMISDDGRQIRFAVSVVNHGTKIWSSQPDENGRMHVNLGSHLYAPSGACVDFDQPRSPIPFVIYPGQKIVLPVRVATDWVVRGAMRIGVEFVQEGVAWFGGVQSFDLLHSSYNGCAPIDRADLLTPLIGRRPFQVGSDWFLLLTMLNHEDHAISLRGEAAMIFEKITEVGTHPKKAAVINSPDIVPAKGYSFICIALPDFQGDGQETLRITLTGEEAETWHLRLETLDQLRDDHKTADQPRRVTFPLVETSSVSSSRKSKELNLSRPKKENNFEMNAPSLPETKLDLLPRTSIDIRTHADQADDEFISEMYRTLKKQDPDREGLNFYLWALESGLMSRELAVKKMISDNGLQDHYQVSQDGDFKQPIVLDFTSNDEPADILAHIRGRYGVFTGEDIKELVESGDISVEDTLHLINGRLNPWFNSFELK